MDLPDLGRFDGYPDSGERKRRQPTVLELWQILGYDPAEEECSGERHGFLGTGPGRKPGAPYGEGAAETDFGGLLF